MNKILIAALVVLVGCLCSQRANAQAYSCDRTAEIDVGAAATTQVVALEAGRAIRVCGFWLSLAAAGTVKWVYGTGTNCATGTTDISDATTLATGTPLSVFISNGFLFKTGVGAALCLTTTGASATAEGLVSYAVQ